MMRYIQTVHKKGVHYALVGNNVTDNYTTEIELVRELKNYPYNINITEWELYDNVGNNAEYEVVNIWCKKV